MYIDVYSRSNERALNKGELVECQISFLSRKLEQDDKTSDMQGGNLFEGS